MVYAGDGVREAWGQGRHGVGRGMRASFLCLHMHVSRHFQDPERAKREYESDRTATEIAHADTRTRIAGEMAEGGDGGNGKRGGGSPGRQRRPLVATLQHDQYRQISTTHLRAHGGLADLNTGVAVLRELPREELVQLGVEDAICDELQK